MKERPTPVEFLIRVFLFGILTHISVYFIYRCLGLQFSNPEIGEQQQLLATNFTDEIACSSVVALAFSLTWIFGFTRRGMTRLLNHVGACTTHGKNDIWDLTFTDDRKQVEYVHV